MQRNYFYAQHQVTACTWCPLSSYSEYRYALFEFKYNSFLRQTVLKEVEVKWGWASISFWKKRTELRRKRLHLWQIRAHVIFDNMGNCVIFSLQWIYCSITHVLVFDSISFCLSESIINVALHGTHSIGHNRHEEGQSAWDSFWIGFILISAIAKFTYHIYLVDTK
jgi:hypothetical protein